MSEGFLLDTNIPSELIKPQPDPRIVTWISSQRGLHLSVISIGEMRKGFHLLAEGKRRTQLEAWFNDFLLPLVKPRILPIDHVVADRWGVLSADRQTNGTPST